MRLSGCPDKRDRAPEVAAGAWVRPVRATGPTAPAGHVAFRVGAVAQRAGEGRIGLDAAHGHALRDQRGAQLREVAPSTASTSLALESACHDPGSATR